MLDIFDSMVAELNTAAVQIISTSSGSSVSNRQYMDVASPLNGVNFVRLTIALIPKHPMPM
jgi:hypothetical protein